MEAAGEIVRLSRCSPYLSAGKKKAATMSVMCGKTPQSPWAQLTTASDSDSDSDSEEGGAGVCA
jgi:hypothetical protein